MKIVLNSVEDLQELIGVLDAEFLRTWQPGLHAPVFEPLVPPSGADPADYRPEATTVNPHPEGTTVLSSAGPVDANLAEALGIAEAGLPAKDADGVPHDTTWHSDPAKINADGRWRARRKRDEVAYEVWASATRLIAGAATDDADPVATETHALPQDDATHDDAADVRRLGVAVMDGAAILAENVPSDPLPTVDHTALIEASQDAAKDAPDGTIDLLNAGKEFIKEYGTAKFEALKSAVCPTEDGKGKSIPSMDPGERRLMRACMDNYTLYL